MLTEPARSASLSILCRCGAPVCLDRAQIACACGADVARLSDDIIVIGPPTPYWGEISEQRMLAMLERGEKIGWREALLELAPELYNNAASPDRAAFQDLLPIPDGSRILDVGAGLGAISCELARRHHVVALEGVRERARWIALRKRQSRLTNLTVLCGDLNRTRFAPGQFDAIIVNGVLEWVGLFDLSDTPDRVQVGFLSALRSSLAPGGYIYLGIENRIGWGQWRGSLDHSGLPYTSLLPRFLASWVCSRNRGYRSGSNHGYRTYTYTHRGYRKLFQRAGLRIRSVWIAPQGYNLPTDLVPLHRQAIEFYSRRRMPLPISRKAWVKNRLRMMLAREWFWRWFGGHYVFLLEASGA